MNTEGPVRIGITGQAGFIGTHLANHFRLFPGKYKVIDFADAWFGSDRSLSDWVSGCDVIVHLAAMNRHGDPQVIYETNIRLVDQLIRALDTSGKRPHIIFASSTQEERDNPYGRSKREGREMLSAWARVNNAPFTGMVIPNVFGPFGNPYYNSAIATFCHQLTHGAEPRIEVDGLLQLIYVGDLANEILRLVDDRVYGPSILIRHRAEKRVSELLDIIRQYKDEYLQGGRIPVIHDSFRLQLFNTFRCFIDIANHYPVAIQCHTDNRGSFAEILRAGTGGQTSFSTTHPGVTRGNHFHTRKIERFAVIRGKARIRLRRVGTTLVHSFSLDGATPSYVDMPVWYTHEITNTGGEDLYTVFWINDPYDPADPDTWPETV